MAGTLDPEAGAPAIGEADTPLVSVVHVDRQEDVATICGRIDAAPSYAVVLSVPAGNRSLSREIGLRRVLRHADENGRTIAFATTNGALASRARALRIPVARKPEHVRWDAGGRAILRVGRRSVLVPAAGRLMQWLLIGAFALLLVIVALTVGPSATVVAFPPSEPVERVLTVTASPDIAEPDFALMRLPAAEVSSNRLVTVAIPTTGSALVGVTAAQLTVTVTNTTAAPVTIPAGARLTTSAGVEFALAAELTIAPGDTQYPAALAVEPGVAGNVGPNVVTGFADPAFALVRAENAGNAGGGASEPRPAVAAEDVATLIATATALENVQAVRSTIVADRPRDAILLDTAAVQVETGAPSPLPGEVADVVVMEVRVQVTALAIVAATLDELGAHVFGDAVEGGEIIPGSIAAVETGKRDATSGEFATEIRLTGHVARDVTRNDVENAVRGRSASSAQSILESRYGIQGAEIDVSPGWAPRLPRFGFRIDVEFHPPADDDRTNTSN